MIISRVNPDLMVEWQIWKLVIERVATLEELETKWSLDDVERAVAAMSVKEDIMASALEGIGKNGHTS